MMMAFLKSEFGTLMTQGKDAKEIQKAFGKFRKRVDYSEYGGAQLVGINGTCVISHGSSTAKAVTNAIRVAAEFATNNVNKHIAEEIIKPGYTIEPDVPSS